MGCGGKNASSLCELSLQISCVYGCICGVVVSSQNRAKITGRVVPQKLLEEVMQQVPASVSRLRNIVDFFVEIQNSGNDGEDVQLVAMSSPYTDMSKNVTWAEFTNQWRSTCHEHGHKQVSSAR